jgi:hypothetical protein
MGQQQEIAEHDDHQRVARAAHLEWFEGHEDDQHGHPRVLAEQAVELPADAGDGADHQQGQRPAWRELAPLKPQPGSPEQGAADQQR